MAPYAHPAPELELSSVRLRRYRGYCLFDMAIYEERLDLFRQKKDDFIKVLEECKYLEEKSRKNALKYLEQFQEIIDNPKKWQQDFNYPCDEKGTGKVVIKGLRN